MNKYSNVQTNIFSIFDSNSWKAENINTVPANYSGNYDEFIRVSIILSGDPANITFATGILQIDIFTKAGEGPNRATLIADKLDSYLDSKTFNIPNVNIQLWNSSIGNTIQDTDNPSLSRVTYSIPFNYFEVQ